MTEKEPEPSWVALQKLKPMLMFYRKEFIMKQLRAIWNLHDEDDPFVEMILRRHPFWTDEDVVKEVKRVRQIIADFQKPDPITEVLTREGYLDE